MKNKGSTINSKSKFKNEVLMDNKEISLKNYLIGNIIRTIYPYILHNEKTRNVPGCYTKCRFFAKDIQNFYFYEEVG